MPRVHDVVPLLDVDGVVKALINDMTALLQSTASGGLHWPRAAPSQGVLSCTYEQWFKPYSPRRRSASSFWEEFGLGCHGLPIPTAAVWLVLAL